MKGFVARDLDDSLWFHYVKPHRENSIEKSWWVSNDWAFRINEKDFPNFPELKSLKWEDAPIEVGFCIHKIHY